LWNAQAGGSRARFSTPWYGIGRRFETTKDVVATTTLRAAAQEGTTTRVEAWELADEVFRQAKIRVKQQMRALIFNRDALLTGLGMKALTGTYPGLHEYRLPEEPAKGVGKGKKQAAI
jgi:hypothetical protein